MIEELIQLKGNLLYLSGKLGYCNIQKILFCVLVRVKQSSRCNSTYTETELAVLFVCCRLMSSGSLRKLLAGWNEVCQLVDRLEKSQLEVLDLQHNHLTELPHNLFIKAHRYTQPHRIHVPSRSIFSLSHLSVLFFVKSSV